MPKWKELPTDTDKLRDLLEKLRDKEMRLEADLAITERPDLAEAVTRLALAIADLKKIDGIITKGEKPTTEEGRREVEAIVARIEYFEHQLRTNKSPLQEKGGKAAEKFAEMRKHRRQSFDQLQEVSDQVAGVCQRNGVDLELLLPSLTNYLSVAQPSVTAIDQQVADMAEPPPIREAREDADHRANEGPLPLEPPAPPLPPAAPEPEDKELLGPTEDDLEQESLETPDEALLRLFQEGT